MSSVLKIHELIKSAALFTLCSLIMLVSLPAQAAQEPDVVGDINKLLADVGTGFFWYIIVILAFILICSFSEGNSRDRRIEDSRQDTPIDEHSKNDKTKQS